MVHAAVAIVLLTMALAGCANEMRQRLRRPQQGIDIEAIRRAVVPLDRVDLGEWIAEGDPRVIGLGEPTHGSGNVRRLHAQILIAAARQWPKLAIFGEWCEDEGEKLDAFVRGHGSAEHVPKVAAPIAWSGAWNEGWRSLRALNARGADIRVFGMRACWPSAHLVDLRDGGIDLDSALVADIDAALTTKSQGSYAEVRAEIARALHDGSAGSADDRRRLADAWHELELFDQSIAPRYDPTQSEERWMAENFRWVLARYAPEHHAIILAHDSHVSRTRTQLLANGRRVELEYLGGHLERWLGTGYRSIAMLVGDGSFCAIRVTRPSAKRTRRFRLRHLRGALERRLAEVATTPWTVAVAKLSADDIPRSTFHLQMGFVWGWPVSWVPMLAYAEGDVLRDFDDVVFFPVAEPDDIVGCSRRAGPSTGHLAGPGWPVGWPARATTSEKQRESFGTPAAKASASCRSYTVITMIEPVLESTTTIGQAEFAVWALRRVHELGRRELIRGHIVVTPPAGFPHGSVEHAVAGMLAGWNERARAGRCFGGSQGFELPTGDTLAPDGSFVSHERWAASVPHPRGKFLRVVPDFVAEVFSSPYDLREKQEIYAKAGVREYWVVDESHRRVVVFTNDGAGTFDAGVPFASDARLTSQVLAGLDVSVARLFVDADE